MFRVCGGSENALAMGFILVDGRPEMATMR
jgi:hypothetical protein